MIRITTIFTLTLLSFMGSSALAQSRFFDQEYGKLGVYSVQFSGENGKSFTEDASSVGLEASKVFDSPWFGIETKVRGGQVSGNQAFDDEGTDINTDYVYYFGEFLLGGRVSFVPARESGFTAHLGLAGIVSLNYLSLDIPASTTTNISNHYSSVSVGTEVSAGGEFRISAGMGRFYSLYMDVGIRSVKSKLANQTGFSLDGMSLSAGLGF